MTEFEEVLETILEEYARRDSEGDFDTWEETDSFVKEKAEVLLTYANLKKELVSDDFEMALAEMINNAQTSVVEPWVIAAQWKDELIKLAKSEEPVSEDLEEAAWLYYDKNRLPIPPEWDLHKEFIDFFKAGANWHKEQLMAKAVETTFNISLPSGLYDKLWIKGCKEWDKLLVIKKDEL